MAFAQPKIELVRCPSCGNDAELWTDEADGTCTQCGKVVCRTTTQSCLDWCKYARECLGEEGHQKYQEMVDGMLRHLRTSAHPSDAVDSLNCRIVCEADKLARDTAAQPAQQGIGTPDP